MQKAVFYLALLSLPLLRHIHPFLEFLPLLPGRQSLYSSHHIGRLSEARPLQSEPPAHNNLPWSKTLDVKEEEGNDGGGGGGGDNG